MDDCVFCKIIRREIKTEIIEETENFVAIPDANPKVKGHALIISKKHYANLIDLPSVLGNELVDIIKKIASLRIKQGAEGFNVLINTGSSAGQVVRHTHVHILPRKKGDKLASLA